MRQRLIPAHAGNAESTMGERSPALARPWARADAAEARIAASDAQHGAELAAERDKAERVRAELASIAEANARGPWWLVLWRWIVG